MDEQIVAIYTLCSDLLIGLHHYEDPQCVMSDAEVMTTALVAAIYFKGNYAAASLLLKDRRYIPKMLSKSQFSRRLHRVKGRFLQLFGLLAEHWKELNCDTIYAIDSFPIAVCDNYRIQRCKIYQEPYYRGYIASKKRYFYGLKIHLMVTKDGQPVEFFLTEGSVNDVSVLDLFDFDVQPGSEIYADRMYNKYWLEDVINESGIFFEPYRKSNSKRDQPPWRKYWLEIHRKRVETTGSQLERLLPKHIHATSAAGFELKVVLFILAISVKPLL
jgi:hypothetical protein